MALQPGTRLGPYEVLSHIGAGGMGEVYRARDTRLDRAVAVKVLAPELADDAEFRARFTREAKAISALNHPHIRGLYDIGHEHNTEWEIYVAAFPTFTSKRQISSGGGFQPQWRGDGRELFYLSPDGSMMSVRVDAGADFTASRPTPLFTTNMLPSGGGTTPQYAVTADGQRFLGLERIGGGKAFTFLLNSLDAKSSRSQP